MSGDTSQDAPAHVFEDDFSTLRPIWPTDVPDLSIRLVDDGLEVGFDGEEGHRKIAIPLPDGIGDAYLVEVRLTTEAGFKNSARLAINIGDSDVRTQREVTLGANKEDVAMYHGLDTLRRWSEVPDLYITPGTPYTMALEVHPGRVLFHVEGREVDDRRLRLGETHGRVGLTIPRQYHCVLHHFRVRPLSDEERARLAERDTARVAAATAALDDLIGMTEIKHQIATLANLLRVQNRRRELGLETTEVGNHMILTGPPGTGKTTVARMLGRIFKALGVLSKGHVVETDRADLVAQYIGQTAPLVDEKVEEAIGGILFIDEAYALKVEDSPRDFGQEAIDALMKRMEDDRDNLVVIIAGYEDKMQGFLTSNPGVRSRFNHHFRFRHYTTDELVEILEFLTRQRNYMPTYEALQKARQHLDRAVASRTDAFGNGRYARNLLDAMIRNQANRLATDPDLDEDEVVTLLGADVPAELLDGMVDSSPQLPGHYL